MNESIGVAIVEDHGLTRSGLRAALEAQPDMHVLGEAADGIAGETVIRETQPAVAVIDIGLPGRDGIELTRVVKGAAPNVRIVILTMHELDDEVLAALSAGADAYCVKSSDPATLLAAIRIVASGGAYFDPRVAHIVLRRLGNTARPTESPLTPRELDVLRLVADGVGNVEIGERLHIGLGTVKAHVRDILIKLSASDRAHAAVSAYRRGLLG